MGSSQAMASATDECRAELAAVRGSELFSRTPALANLLTYLCEKTLAGEAHQIKEYTIAVEVFGRAVDYDQEADSIVRVEAARLRKRLKQFYEGPGADHHMQIAIPVGQYVPVFREHETTADTPEGIGAAVPVTHPESADHSAEVECKAVESAPGKAGHKGRPWALIGVGGVLVSIIVALLLILVLRAPRPEVASSRASEVPKPPADVVNGIPAGEELRILCGSDRQYIDRAGKTWLADRYFNGGSPVRVSVPHIWRTPDPEIYKTSRQGDFTYDIPLAPGIYELHLHFAEINYGPEEQAGGGEGSRILGVSANGQPLIASLDVVADSGARTADVKVFTDVHPADDGILHLKFWSLHGGRGMVTAIEVLPGRKGRIRPIRITTRDSAYYSNDSRWWSPDIYFKGGQLAKYSDPVSGADDPELYESERWGNFSYAIPVPPGRYALTLSFVERCGPTARDGCVGTEAANPERERSFNVVCNGKPLLREFNILKEAGGLRKVVEKRFTGVEPNAQGKLLVDFVPSKGYARVTGIEVLPE